MEVRKTKNIEVVPYDPEWKTEFEKLKVMINSYIGDLILSIEHVGSTSIEGLAVKPIIDLDVVISSSDNMISQYRIREPLPIVPWITALFAYIAKD